MNPLGKHLILDYWNCNLDKLNNLTLLKKIFIEATLKSGAEIREVNFHQFAPVGVSGVVIISEPHLTIHTFPEYGYASVDIYTCGQKVKPELAASHIKSSLEADILDKRVIHRGKVKPENINKGCRHMPTKITDNHSPLREI